MVVPELRFFTCLANILEGNLLLFLGEMCSGLAPAHPQGQKSQSTVGIVLLNAVLGLLKSKAFKVWTLYKRSLGGTNLQHWGGGQTWHPIKSYIYMLLCPFELYKLNWMQTTNRQLDQITDISYTVLHGRPCDSMGRSWSQSLTNTSLDTALRVQNVYMT